MYLSLQCTVFQSLADVQHNYNSYYQYGYGQTGVPGQPGQQAAPAAHGHGHMSQPNSAGVAGHGADANGAGAQAQGGWDQAAAAAYYQNQGWGGYYGESCHDQKDVGIGRVLAREKLRSVD